MPDQPEGDDDDLTLGNAEGQNTEGQGDQGAEGAADLSTQHPDDQADDGEQEELTDGGGGRGAPSRGQSRIQRLANERAEHKARADRLEQELAEARRSQWQRDNQQTEAQERERLALMTPEERADYRISQIERKFSSERHADRMAHQSAMDKVSYDAKASTNPVYAKFADEVEARFQQQMQQGRPVEREIILRLLLGERALSGAAAGNGAARRQGRSRVESQRVAAGSGKGDAASARGKAGETPESRLKDVFI